MSYFNQYEDLFDDITQLLLSSTAENVVFNCVNLIVAVLKKYTLYN